VIKHYAAVIDHVAIGLKDIVFIASRWTSTTTSARPVRRRPQNPGSHRGQSRYRDYDYLVKVAVADTTHYERFLREKLYRIQGIRHTRSTFSLRTLKLVMSADPLLVNASV
jgi:Lrp/AsnC family leucine-responsive transcriptional regulator